jgi:hypothetical protein
MYNIHVCININIYISMQEQGGNARRDDDDGVHDDDGGDNFGDAGAGEAGGAEEVGDSGGNARHTTYVNDHAYVAEESINASVNAPADAQVRSLLAFTGTKVQILTQKVWRRSWSRTRLVTWPRALSRMTY